MNYGEKVRAARTARGWTVEYTALECGINTRTLARIEKGTNPTIATHRKLTEILGEL